jgi:MSHA pilin protein MshD
MCIPDSPAPRLRERGLTLIELVMFIVIVGIAVVAILQVMSNTTKSSVDPQLRKQALAVAEALLEEVRLMPFTVCDPDGYDASATPPTCAKLEAMGPESAYANQPANEARGSNIAPFDNVNDYHGFTLTGGGNDLGGSTNVAVPAGYTATVAVAEDAAFGPAGSLLPQADVLRISVTVNYSGGSVVVEGYRTRHAPNPVP